MKTPPEPNEGEIVRNGIIWQMVVCADNFERVGKLTEAAITRWHIEWIKRAAFGKRKG